MSYLSVTSFLHFPLRTRRYEQGSQGTVAKISSGLGKIKGALQTKQPIEGFYTPESQMYDNDATHYTNDVMAPVIGFRDLTAWRVSIRNFDTIYSVSDRILNFLIIFATLRFIYCALGKQQSI